MANRREMGAMDDPFLRRVWSKLSGDDARRVTALVAEVKRLRADLARDAGTAGEVAASRCPVTGKPCIECVDDCSLIGREQDA